MTSADVKDDPDSDVSVLDLVDLREADVQIRARDRVDHTVHVVAPPQLSDLWQSISSLPRFMPLFRILVWRVIRLRYTQSYLGLIWLALQPITQASIILFLFTLINVHTGDGAHQGLFLFAGATSWGFFARSVGDAQGSLYANAGILTKVYMPKIMLPLASIIAAWLDTVIVIALLVIVSFTFGIPPTFRLLWLPAFLALISLTSLSFGLGLAPINALYRDIGVLIPLVLQVLMVLSPVYYSTRFIPGKYQLIYHLNPMTSLLEGVRWTILPDSPAPNLNFLLVNFLCILTILIVSLLIYQKLESPVVDRI